MAEEQTKTPATKVRSLLKGYYSKFMKTPLPIPTAVAMTVVLYFLYVVYGGTTCCLMGLIAPAALLMLLWSFEVKDIKKLLIVGFVTALLCATVQMSYLTYGYMDLEPMEAESEDLVMTDGYVTPMHGDADLVYNYTVPIHADNLSVIQDVNLTVIGYKGNMFDAAIETNLTMGLVSWDNTSRVAVYGRDVITSEAINFYIFWANVDGNWTYASSIGPIHDSFTAVMVPWAIFSFELVLIQFFPMYAIMVFMIWWTKRARRMREAQVQKWEAESRKKMEEQKAKERKEDTKVPSLAKAMGLEPEGDTFVCSECGADVPSEATVCPKCGEKFDGETAEQQKEEAKEPTPAKPKKAEPYGDTFVCSECGAEVLAEATKCPKCGEKFD